MLEKIKKLLDSGCWVAVETDVDIYNIIGYNDNGLSFLLDINLGRLIIDMNRIKHIKTIARPLYQYKVGDKVIVLENYEGDKFEVGEVYEVLGGMGGNVNLSTDGTIDKTFPMDVRCIAPVLD